MSKKGFSIKDMVLCALFAAICCVFSILTLPIGVVPISFATFGVMATTMILGEKRAIISVVLFIAMGVIGLPVFAGMQGGLSAITGPTGGYIYSYILMVPIVGLASKCLNKTVSSGMFTMLGCLAAMFVNYLVGTIHFVLVASVPDNGFVFTQLIMSCVLIFIPGDIIKSILAIIIAPRLKPLCK